MASPACWSSRARRPRSPQALSRLIADPSLRRALGDAGFERVRRRSSRCTRAPISSPRRFARKPRRRDENRVLRAAQVRRTIRCPPATAQLARALLRGARACRTRRRWSRRVCAASTRTAMPQRQARLRRLGARIAAAARRAVARAADRPDALVHVPRASQGARLCSDRAVSRALGIPYVVAEASIAPSQRDGPLGGRPCARASPRFARPTASIFLNPADVAGRARRAARRRARRRCSRRSSTSRRSPAHRAARGSPRATGTRAPDHRRDDARRREARVVPGARRRARASASTCRGRCAIVGDGPRARDVEARVCSIRDRVSFAGARAGRRDRGAACSDSDLFVWPAIDEAIGIVFLEAQACGVPVVGARHARRRRASSPPGERGCSRLWATPLRSLPRCDDSVNDGELRGRMGGAAFVYVRQHHDLPRAAAQLDAMLRGVVERHRVTA